MDFAGNSFNESDNVVEFFEADDDIVESNTEKDSQSGDASRKSDI